MFHPQTHVRPDVFKLWCESRNSHDSLTSFPSSVVFRFRMYCILNGPNSVSPEAKRRSTMNRCSTSMMGLAPSICRTAQFGVFSTISKRILPKVSLSMFGGIPRLEGNMVWVASAVRPIFHTSALVIELTRAITSLAVWRSWSRRPDMLRNWLNSWFGNWLFDVLRGTAREAVSRWGRYYRSMIWNGLYRVDMECELEGSVFLIGYHVWQQRGVPQLHHAKIWCKQSEARRRIP